MAQLPSAALSDFFMGFPGRIYNGAAWQGNTVRIRKIKLDAAGAYPAGGWQLEQVDTGLSRVYSYSVLGQRDPNGFDIVPPPVWPRVTNNTEDRPQLRLYAGATEVAAGTIQPANSYVWIQFIGVA